MLFVFLGSYEGQVNTQAIRQQSSDLERTLKLPPRVASAPSEVGRFNTYHLDDISANELTIVGEKWNQVLKQSGWKLQATLNKKATSFSWKRGLESISLAYSVTMRRSIVTTIVRSS